MIAVACESSVMFFKDFAPLMKFDLPPIVFSEQEMTIWNQLPNEHDDASFLKLTEDLFNIREQGTKVSCLTNELVSMEDVNEQRTFVINKKDS